MLSSSYLSMILNDIGCSFHFLKHVFIKNVKKIITHVFSRLDLLPFYGRLVATLAPCLPDISQDLVFLLKGDFRFHVCRNCFFFLFILHCMIIAVSN